MSAAISGFEPRIGKPRTQDPPRISVIVPVLNEEAILAAALESLTQVEGIHEIIVVDGGSEDRTVEIARTFSTVRVLAAAQGRSSQLNAGAEVARGNVLLFLHADVSLPSDAARQVAGVLADPHVVAGAFRTWTVAPGQRTWLAPLLHLADVRSRYTRLPYGDQAPFVRRTAFQRAGGYPPLPLMEDLEFSRRLRRLGRIGIAQASVRVSGRRFLARPVYYTFLVNIFPALYRAGIAPERLARWYRHIR